VSKNDKSAVIQRQKKGLGVKSSFIDDKGQEICDSTVSGDAPDFLVDLNRRVDEKMILHPPAYKQPWHNRSSPRKMHGMHSSTTSTETWTQPKGGVRVGYETNYGHNSSFDTPYFIAESEKRSHQQGEANPTERTILRQQAQAQKAILGRSSPRSSPRSATDEVRRSNIMRAAGASYSKRASWDNRNVMGGCHGRVSLKEAGDYAQTIAGI
jgi:hypothetical protein